MFSGFPAELKQHGLAADVRADDEGDDGHQAQEDFFEHGREARAR